MAEKVKSFFDSRSLKRNEMVADGYSYGEHETPLARVSPF